MNDYIQDDPTFSTVTVPVKTIAWTHQINAAVRQDAEHMRIVAESAIEELKRYAAEMPIERDGFVVTPTDDPSMSILGSVFVRDIVVPAPRRWWHRLLFLHPTEMGTRWDEMPGDFAGADYYRLGWRQHVIECPPEMAGRVRSGSRSVQFAIHQPH